MGRLYLTPPARGGSKVPLFEKLGSYLVVLKYFRSKSVCMIVGNSVKSTIYYRRTGILRTKYRITMGVGCWICSASYFMDRDIYYTFYRISEYHAYRVRPEIFWHHQEGTKFFKKGFKYFHPPHPRCVRGPKKIAPLMCRYLNIIRRIMKYESRKK